MKFKKEIATLLLASALLTASFTACNTPQNGGDDINHTTPEITTIETTPDTKPNDTSNPNEVIRDVSELGKLKSVPYSDMKNASIWQDEKGEFFLYINEWNAYRHLSGLTSDPYHYWFYFTDNCIVVGDETTTITLINQVGKHDEPTIITYHFNRDNKLVELHAVPLNIIASSEYDTFFVNMHTADHGYYFLTPSMDGSQDWRMDGVSGWPLFMFETTDGGKSWNQISTNTFDFCTSDGINIVKFISPNIGILSFRYVNLEDLCERTYLTLDGGLTWSQISQLPYPLDKKWGYSEVVDMTLIDDCYCLTVKLSDNDQGKLQFWSKDLQNWTLMPSSENNFDSNQNAPSVLYKYEEETGGKVYLQIDAWNQTVVLPFTYTDIKNLEFVHAAAIYSAKGIFVYSPDGLGKSIKILSFTKGSDEITEQTITWDKPICESEIFCNFVDDKNGYIFVIEEGGHSDFAYGYAKVSKLYKTQDGGKNWTSVDCDNAPYTDLKECMILAKFATEDIGIIAGRHYASDYSFRERTYITKDGGLTWIPVDLSNFFEFSPDRDWGIQAYDLQYIDGTYYLYVQAVQEGADKLCYLFTSSDGVEWNYIKTVD